MDEHNPDLGDHRPGSNSAEEAEYERVLLESMKYTDMTEEEKLLKRVMEESRR